MIKKQKIVAACTLLVSFFLMPQTVDANVYINEVAWMGTAVSANDEWIELYNDGAESIDLSGWKLIAQDDDPDISLSGSIAAGSYFLLERTDDLSVPDLSADLIYSGSLGNTGEVLVLRDSLGSQVDKVESGANWSIGGNNAAKYTPQRQEDASWITGVATPKARNTTESTATSSLPDPGSGGTTNKKTGESGGGYKQKVYAYAGEERYVTVGADTMFEGYAVDQSNKRITTARYTWTFGDGEKRTGKEVYYAYKEPGTYVAVLNISAHTQKAQAKFVVHAVPANVSISDVKHGDGGYVEIENFSDTEQSLAGWKLKGVNSKKKTRMFTFPDSTILLPTTAVRFSAYTTRLPLSSKSPIALLYPDEKVASEYNRDRSLVAGASTTGPLLVQQPDVHIQHMAAILQTQKNTPAIQENTMPDNEDRKEAVSTISTATFTSTNSPLILSTSDTDTVYSWPAAVATVVGMAIAGLWIYRKYDPEKEKNDIEKEAQQFEIVEV